VAELLYLAFAIGKRRDSLFEALLEQCVAHSTPALREVLLTCFSDAGSYDPSAVMMRVLLGCCASDRPIRLPNQLASRFHTSSEFETAMVKSLESALRDRKRNSAVMAIDILIRRNPPLLRTVVGLISEEANRRNPIACELSVRDAAVQELCLNSGPRDGHCVKVIRLVGVLSKIADKRRTEPGRASPTVAVPPPGYMCFVRAEFKAPIEKYARARHVDWTEALAILDGLVGALVDSSEVRQRFNSLPWLGVYVERKSLISLAEWAEAERYRLAIAEWPSVFV
jgi:hypothetical protein